MLSPEEKLNLINQIEQKLDLQFLNEIVYGNLCFTNNNSDLQNEFKQFFTETDFFNFIKSFISDEIQIPHDALTFWELVEKGKKNI